MRKRIAVLAIAVCVLMLSGCIFPHEPVPLPDPFPFSFSDPNKPVYPRTLAGAQTFLTAVRARWTRNEESRIAQPPMLTYRASYGDCDDFAIMVAAFLQEYWGFDTILVFMTWSDSPYGHVVAYVNASHFPIDFSHCPIQPQPGFEWAGELFLPLDEPFSGGRFEQDPFYGCAPWTWACFPGGRGVPWHDLTVVTIGRGHPPIGVAVLAPADGPPTEWYDAVYAIMDERDLLKLRSGDW